MTHHRTDRLQELLDLGAHAVARAQALGADVAEASVQEGSYLTAKVRLGKPELLEEAGSRSLGLRVMLGQQVAVSSSCDLRPEGVERLVADAVELARLSEPDAFAGPPDASQLSDQTQYADVDSYDAAVATVEADAAITQACIAEQAARDADPRITNSEGATVTRVTGTSELVTSGGFAGTTRGSYASLVVTPVAEDADGKKRRGFHWTARRHLADLDDPKTVGVEAARRTIRKLGAIKLASGVMPVVFDPDAARSLIGLVSGCVSGSAVWRKSSYLAGRLGEQVASEHVTLVDNPFLKRAPGSRPFDGEGLLSRRTVVVEKGVLNTYLMDTYSAKKLQMASTASASRGGNAGVGVGTTNFLLLPGTTSPEDIVAGVTRGFYVTEMMGFGFNPVTGDFSRGASGFLIEDGTLTKPVSEVTISLNLNALFQRIDAVGDDLDLRTATASPTFRVSAMTIAGT